MPPDSRHDSIHAELDFSSRRIRLTARGGGVSTLRAPLLMLCAALAVSAVTLTPMVLLLLWSGP